jgi:hypothetical protein
MLLLPVRSSRTGRPQPSGFVRSARRPPPPGKSRTTTRTTPVAIVTVMATELRRAQVQLRASGCTRRSRRQPVSRSRCGLAGEIPAGAARCRATAQPRQPGYQNWPSDMAVAKRLTATWPVARPLAKRLPGDVAGCQNACHGFRRANWPVAGPLAAGLPPVAAHRQGWDITGRGRSPGWPTRTQKLTKVVGLGKRSGKRFGKRPRGGCLPTLTCSGGGAVMTTRGAAAALFGDGGPRCPRW